MAGESGGAAGGSSGGTSQPGATTVAGGNGQKSIGDQARANIAKSMQAEGNAKKEAQNQQKGEESSQANGKEEGARDVMKRAAENAKKKYKVFGEEVEIDASRTDEYVQKGLAFDRKGSKIAEMEKKYTQFEQAIQKGDRNAVRKLLGDDRFHQFAVDHINELIEQEEMSPQERAYRERENKLKAREEEIESFKKQEQEKYNKQLEDHYAKKFDKEFTDAFEESGLPKHPRVMNRMVSLMQQNLNMELDLPASQIAKLVKQEIEGEVKSLLGALDGDALSSILGDEVAQRIRQHGISQLKDPLAGNRATGPIPVKDEKPAGKPLFGSIQETRPTKDDWKDKLAKIKQGR
jgi:hypothetical protein